MKIIPSNKLIFFFGTVCFPFTLLSGHFSDYPALPYIIIGLFIIVSIFDALLSYKTLHNTNIKLPEIIRMAKGKEIKIPLSITTNNSGKKIIKVGLSFPNNIFSINYETTINTQSSEIEIYQWPVTGLKQGCYFLDKYYLEKASPMGLWLKRDNRKTGCELRVYPDLFSEQKTIAAIFKNNFMGIHTQKMIGKGREFEKLREYVSGDSYEDIHWKATAKRGIPVSKIFQIERTQDIYVLIDSSRMSSRETTSSETSSKDTILDRYITAALTVGMAAEKQGDNFGVGVFSDKVSHFIKAKNGKAHSGVCRDLLYKTELHRTSPDFSEFFTFTGTKIRKRSLLIILTNLDDPVLSENFLKHIHILSRRHIIIVGMIKPAFAKPIFSSENINSVDDVYQKLAGHILWNTLREVEQSLYRHGVGFSLLSENKLSLELISKYIDIKQRQLI